MVLAKATAVLLGPSLVTTETIPVFVILRGKDRNGCILGEFRVPRTVSPSIHVARKDTDQLYCLQLLRHDLIQVILSSVVIHSVRSGMPKVSHLVSSAVKFVRQAGFVPWRSKTNP